jgi:hypothetical protein
MVKKKLRIKRRNNYDILSYDLFRITLINLFFFANLIKIKTTR